MHWTRLDQRWQARGEALEGQELEAGITYELAHWKVPGEPPLPIRVVSRDGFPLRSYTPGFELEATSIVLHESNSYGNFSRLMGGNSLGAPSRESVHFVVGRDGNAYLIVPIDRVAWHAGDWSTHSIGIEIDNLGPLHERAGDEADGLLYSAFGDTDEYCSKGDTEQYLRESFHGTDYWAAWTDAQYDCAARLIKAVCHRAKIPRYIQDEHSRFTPLNRLPAELQLKFRGVTSHYQVDPSHGADIGPTIDWRRLVDSAGLIEGDCFHTPPYSDEETEHPEVKPFEHTSDAAEERAIHGDLKLAGDYIAGRGFVDRDLNGLLQHYCEADGLEPTHTSANGLPAWLTSWQTELPRRSWDAGAQGRSRLIEAYLRSHFRAACKAKGLDYAPSADELFAAAAAPEADDELDLERTPGFGAARRALSRSLLAHGWLLDGDRDWTPPEAKDEQRAGAGKILPGDVITFASPEGPRSGRIGTVVFAEGESGEDGVVWIAAPDLISRSIKIERFNLERTPDDFNPGELQDDVPRERWLGGEAAPQAGGAWLISIERTSAVQRSKVDRMTDAERAQLKLMQGELEATPGTMLSTAAKLGAGERLIAEAKIRFDVRDLAGAKNPHALRAPPLGGAERKNLGSPIPVASHSVRLNIGEHPGRLAFRIFRPAPKSPAAALATSVNEPYAEDERDAFLQIALGFLGAPYLASSTDPAPGLDGVALVAAGLRQLGVLPSEGPALTASGLNGMFSFLGGTIAEIPEGIVPGDIAWFGTPSRDIPAQQHPMIYLGNGKVLGPIPDGGPRGSAVQIAALRDVPDQFAGWTHIDDLGTAHAEPAAIEPPADSEAKLGAALLPASAAGQYDALEKLAKAKKSTWFHEENQVNLIGIKNLHGRALILPAEDGWNDTVFAAWLDEREQKHCLELRAALNPGTDKNHAETWQLLEGSYTFQLAQGDGIDTQTLQPDGEIRGFFDEHSAGAFGIGDRKAEGDKLISQGGYTKVPIQLAPGGTGAIARPTKGTQLIWGGRGAGSAWTALTTQIEKSGAPVSYLLLSSAELSTRMPAAPATQAPGAMPITGTDKRLQGADQQGPLQIEPKPNSNAPGLSYASGPSGRGRLFDAGLNVSYQGEAMRLWAHPRAANSGPRPLVIFLHDINPNSDQHPALSADVGKAHLPWMHLGKLAQRLIEQGKVTPLAIAAPTNAAAAPWGSIDFQDVFNLAENKFKELGVEIDPTQIAVVGHGGAAGYEQRGMLKLAAEHAQIGEAKVKLFGLADARITASIGDAIREGLQGNEATAIYSLHRYVGGWAGAEHFESGGSEGFAKAIGATENNRTHVVADEELESVESYWDNGEKTPARVSIQVNASMGDRIPRWRKAGAYGAGDLGSHANTVARWTAWALPRFFAQTDADKTLLALDHEHQPQAALAAPAITGGEFNIPPAAKPWTNPAGSVPPKALDGFEFAAASGLYYPLRADKLPAGRGVYYVGNDDASYGPNGKGGGGGAYFLANRGREGRKHTGIDVGIGALNAVVVAAEAGTIVDFVKVLDDACNLIVEGDSGTVISYGEIDADSLKTCSLKKGARVAAGQPIGQLRKNQSEARLVFETWRKGTMGTIPYYPNATPAQAERFAQRELARRQLLNPTLYLLALARFGR